MAEKTIPELTLLTSIDRAADLFEVSDTSDSGNSKRTTINSMLDLTSHPVGIDDVQTLTNKTITAPTVSSPVLSGSVIGTYTLAGTPTFPSSVVTLTGSQTLTNKVLTSPTISTPTITNPTITVDSLSEFTSGNGITIDGLNIKDGKLNTNNSVVAANITAGILTNDKLSTTAGELGGEWQTWSPTLTNFTIGTGGNAAVVAYYQQIGKTVRYRIRATLGTSGQSVSGAIAFTLPVAPKAEYYNAITEGYHIGEVKLLDASTALYLGRVQVTNSTTATIVALNAASTYLQQTTSSATVPFSWGAGDMWFGEGFYEAA